MVSVVNVKRSKSFSLVVECGDSSRNAPLYTSLFVRLKVQPIVQPMNFPGFSMLTTKNRMSGIVVIHCFSSNYRYHDIIVQTSPQLNPKLFNQPLPHILM